MAAGRLKTYPLPDAEPARLADLQAQQILDTPKEAAFDRIVSLAARLFDTPMAAITFVDADRQWFKSQCGLASSETPRSSSLCTYAMAEATPMVVTDATADSRFLDNPLVTGAPGIRFYVGAPIRSRQGLPLGALCVLDRTARPLPAQSLLDSLADLAFLVSEQLQQRLDLQASRAAELGQQQHLERERRRAEAANRAKSDFLARMSHEIRTPMNLIMGWHELLLESSLTAKQRQQMERCQRNGQRLLRLVNEILDLSKVESGALQFKHEPFDLKDVLEECSATVAAAVEQQHLQFDVSLDPGVHRFWLGDPERLQQVLLNLLGNAIKFTTGGRIGLRVQSEPAPAAEIEPAAPGLRFEVSDTGCGIPKDKANLIFEPFAQAQESLGRPYEGTGLGLAIARSLVEQMGGRIWVMEKEGPGATFVFTARLTAASEADVSRPLCPPPTPGAPALKSGTRILLADDNPDNVALMQAYLEREPVWLDLASNGREALEKCRQRQYDLILMDVQMPLLDGYAATREIRRHEHEQQLPRVPIIPDRACPSRLPRKKRPGRLRYPPLKARQPRRAAG